LSFLHRQESLKIIKIPAFARMTIQVEFSSLPKLMGYPSLMPISDSKNTVSTTTFLEVYSTIAMIIRG
jgi:hypothetical protein